MISRKESWFTLASGKPFYPFDPKPESVFIGNISRALSHICRYNGHCATFYSVAQHSVICSQKVASGFELAALLHDATEAYVGDLIRPIKVFMPDYTSMEDELYRRAIAPRFGLPTELPKEVHEVDNQVLVTEARDLLPYGADLMKKWGIEDEPFDDVEVYNSKTPTMTPVEAEAAFLSRFYELYEGDVVPHIEDHVLTYLSSGPQSASTMSFHLSDMGVPVSGLDDIIASLKSRGDIVVNYGSIAASRKSS